MRLEEEVEDASLVLFEELDLPAQRAQVREAIMVLGGPGVRAVRLLARRLLLELDLPQGDVRQELLQPLLAEPRQEGG